MVLLEMKGTDGVELSSLFSRSNNNAALHIFQYFDKGNQIKSAQIQTISDALQLHFIFFLLVN